MKPNTKEVWVRWWCDEVSSLDVSEKLLYEDEVTYFTIVDIADEAGIFTQVELTEALGDFFLLNLMPPKEVLRPLYVLFKKRAYLLTGEC